MSDIKEFNYKIIYGATYKDSAWVRIGYFGCGIFIKKTPKVFSERQGITKSISLPHGWRIRFLKALK